MSGGNGATITKNALLKPIRRVLWRWGWHLEVLRGEQADQNGGRYCLVDSNGNVKGRQNDLEALGRELLVLCDGEMVEDAHDGGEALDYPTGMQVLLQIHAALPEQEWMSPHHLLQGLKRKHPFM